jgi:hypothetical protein
VMGGYESKSTSANGARSTQGGLDGGEECRVDGSHDLQVKLQATRALRSW